MNMNDGNNIHVKEVSELKKLLSKHLSLSSSKKRSFMKSKRMTTKKKNMSKRMSQSRRNRNHKND